MFDDANSHVDVILRQAKSPCCILKGNSMFVVDFSAIFNSYFTKHIGLFFNFLLYIASKHYQENYIS